MGLMARARKAGATPANTPKAESEKAEPSAMEKEMRKLPEGSEGKLPPMPLSAATRIKTATTIPVSPARSVRVALSVRICIKICAGRAPIARRTPISVVRSFTTTIIMFETPILPESKVPMPMSQTRILMPSKSDCTIWNIDSTLMLMRAC